MNDGHCDTRTLINLAGLTERQVQYWCEQGVLRPRVRASGYKRWFSRDELALAWLLGALLARGRGAHAAKRVVARMRRAPGLLRRLASGGWLVVQDGVIAHAKTERAVVELAVEAEGDVTVVSMPAETAEIVRR